MESRHALELYPLFATFKLIKNIFILKLNEISRVRNTQNSPSLVEKIVLEPLLGWISSKLSLHLVYPLELEFWKHFDWNGIDILIYAYKILSS